MKNKTEQYLLVKTECRDGEHEYTDVFCVIDDCDLDDDDLERAVLDWNYGGVEWEEAFNTWTDTGLRALSLYSASEITKKEHDVMEEYIYSFSTSMMIKHVISNAIDKALWEREKKEKVA
tara:strand:+ start:338 stop:697 length:360 start_codon:yes stop_codon:yes gene_type:complete